MKCTIGDNIRALRKKNNITQEKLAEYLNVSYQSISKWENNITLPHISLLPAIANMFNVSIDELYNFTQEKTNYKIKYYSDEYKRLCNIGDNEGRVKLMRQAISEYPKTYMFLNYLARSLYRCNGSDIHSDEIISLCERILDDCTDDTIRASALQTIARTYHLIGEKAKAVEYAMCIPTMRQSREFVLKEILDGEEKIKQLEENLFFFTYNAAKEITYLADDVRGMGAQLTSEEKIRMYKAANTIYETIADDENYLILNGKLYWHYNWIASHYSILGNIEEAMSNLLKAEKAAREMDNFIKMGKEKNYTSLLLSKVTSNPKGALKHWQGTHCHKLYKMLQYECYDTMRDMTEFKLLEKRLQEE